jgi:hypothetical protein
MPYFTVFGGDLREGISLYLHGGPPVADTAIKENIERTAARSVPLCETSYARRPGVERLAVVGGGPSTTAAIEALKGFDGDIWAINGTCRFLREHGIQSTFFAIDPHPTVVQWAVGVERALVASNCDKGVFDVLKDAEVSTFTLGNTEAGHVRHGSSSATATMHLSVVLGYRDVVYYGCESSYDRTATHAFMKEDRKDELLIRVGGDDYLTAPDYLIQSLEMASIFRGGSPIWREESGGLLRAMVLDTNYQIIWASDGMVQRMRPAEGFTPPPEVIEDIPNREMLGKFAERLKVEMDERGLRFDAEGNVHHVEAAE